MKFHALTVLWGQILSFSSNLVRSSDQVNPDTLQPWSYPGRKEEIRVHEKTLSPFTRKLPATLGEM